MLAPRFHLHKAMFFILAMACATILSAQKPHPTSPTYPTAYFRHPLTLPVSMAGGFAEIRPNHFHSGLDLRTDGKEGAQVYAPADGYVSRINISAWGGGKVLYITHPNGYRTVYMHLSAFCGEIGKFVHDYQYEHHCFAFDIDLPKDSIRVKQGDLVALTGNTGGSGGPHLHYEIRYADNDQPINPLYFGIKYDDKVAPIIDNIKIYPADSQTTIDGSHSELRLNGKVRRGKKSIDIRRDTVTVAGRFYTGIYTYDRMEAGARNKNGVERIELYVDGELFHRYAVPTFLFEETRAINAIIDYPEYRRTREYYIVTRHLRGDRNHFSSPVRDNGYLQFSDGAVHRLEYRVSDHKGNKTCRTFYVQSKALPADTLRSPLATIQSVGEPISYFKRFDYHSDGFQATINPGTIYENDYVIYHTGTDAARLSPLHHFNLKQYPLPPHEAFLVRLAMPKQIPAALQKKLTIVCINGKDCSACPTKTTSDTGGNTWLEATTRSFGAFAVRLDTVAPQVASVNFSDGKAFRGSELKIKISDDLTGIVSYDCYINDHWELAEHDGKTATLSVSSAALRAGKNDVHLVVTDAAGNTSDTHWFIAR